MDLSQCRYKVCLLLQINILQIIFCKHVFVKTILFIEDSKEDAKVIPHYSIQTLIKHSYDIHLKLSVAWQCTIFRNLFSLYYCCKHFVNSLTPCYSFYCHYTSVLTILLASDMRLSVGLESLLMSAVAYETLWPVSLSCQEVFTFQTRGESYEKAFLLVIYLIQYVYWKKYILWTRK